MMTKRPRHKIILDKKDKIGEILTLLILLIHWILVITYYPQLENEIPIHFNALGEVDRVGAKSSFIFLPILASLLYLGLSWLGRFPHLFNFPREVTEANALVQYTNASKMLRYVKLIMQLIFGSISYTTISIALGHSDGMNVWFLPTAMGVLFVPIIIFIVRSIRQR